MLAECTKFQSQNVQMFGYVFHDTNGQNHGKIQDPVVPLERNLYGHPLARLLWERQFEEAVIRTWMGEISELWIMFVHRKQGFISVRKVDDIKLSGKKQNMAPMWKNLMIKSWYWRTNIISWPCIFGMYSAWITYFCWRHITHKQKAWSHDMEGHAKKSVSKDVVSWRTKKRAVIQSSKVLALMITASRKRNLDLLENCFWSLFTNRS